jgi:hypothetical protein
VNQPPSIIELMDNDRFFGRWFRGESWNAWRAFLATMFALPMTDAQLEIYKRHTGRTTAPVEPCRQAWVCCGRRGGKSIIAALVSVYLSAFRDWEPYLGPGEVATSMTVSPDRRQSRVIFRFQRGFARAIPSIESMVVGETKESLELSNRTVLETGTASDKTLRGYTSHCIVNDEIAFLPTDDCATPDAEILIAEKPCLASLPGSLLLSISSPYARAGEMWNAYEQHFGKDGDPVLFWKAASIEMNPSLDPAIIAAAYELDPAVAAAEWGGEFRSDSERLFTDEILNGCTDFDRPEILPPNFQEE